jgi:hypothetical protein
LNRTDLRYVTILFGEGAWPIDVIFIEFKEAFSLFDKGSRLALVEGGEEK